MLPVKGKSLEIRMRFQAGKHACGIKLACSPDGREETRIGYDPNQGKISIDRTKSSLMAQDGHSFTPLGLEKLRETSISLPCGEDLELDIFFDRSVIEVFVNKQFCLTSRIYPALPESDGIKVFSCDPDPKVVSIEIWQMKPIW